MYNTVFFLIVGVLLFDFLLSSFLDYLNTTRWSNELPKEVEGIYDAEKYRKSQDYQRDNMKLSTMQSILGLAVIMVMLFIGGFAIVDGWVREITQNQVVMALLFFGILMFASDIINTPFSYYDTFVIEEKYGFNKTTKKTFFLDKIKGWLLGAIIGGGLLALIVWFYQKTGQYFWLYAWALVTVFMVFITMFYSNLIVPLFNKQTPLEEGELRNAIEDFSRKEGFKLKNIFVIDGSKRSTKANAYFSGLGAKKRIVLFDTLVNDMEPEEIVAVLAHEVGHYKKKHTLAGMVLSVLQTGLTLYILSLLVDNPELSKALGTEKVSFHLGLFAFGILYSPVSTILGLGMNIFSRRNEYQADRFAKDHYSADPLIEALKKLSVKNLSNLTPHPAYVFFHYSHPPLLKRVKALRE